MLCKKLGEWQNQLAIDVICNKLGERQNQLAIAQAKAPSRSYMEMVHLLMNWIEDVENRLSKDVFKITELRLLKEQLTAWQVSIIYLIGNVNLCCYMLISINTFVHT